MNNVNTKSNYKVYFIADTHFGCSEDKLERLNRPYSSVEEMNKDLVRRWNSVVTSNDVVYIVGDFADTSEAARRYSELLNGYKVLILGNHDKLGYHKYLDEVYQGFITTKLNGRNLVMCHYPMIEWPGSRREHEDQGSYLIHGHTHDNLIQFIPLNSHCVSVERIDYTPIRLKELLDKDTSVMKQKFIDF